MNEPELLRAMLHSPNRTIAVVGLSDLPGKPSYIVSAYMQKHGYRILPVNPLIKSVLGETSYPSLADLPLRPDVVNVFRLPKALPGIVDQMIALKLTDLWAQQGIVHAQAAATAEAAGIHVVMDRCMMIEHQQLTLA